jgi:ProP effector
MSDPAPKSGRRNELLDRLSAEFPVFRDHLPLAIGIHKALMERFPDLDKGQVRSALHLHTGTTRYLKAIIEGAQRLDLDGNPCAAVTAEQHAQAAATLRERFKKAAERRKAEQEAQQRQEKLRKLAEKFNPR